MSEPTTTRPMPKCDMVEVIKRPTRQMFMRIKKIKGRVPAKDQRPFAWDQFKDDMRLIDIKETTGIHAGKVTYWMRQDPPLMELVDIPDEQFEKELAKWYEKKGMTPPASRAAKKAEEKPAKKSGKAAKIAGAAK